MDTLIFSEDVVLDNIDREGRDTIRVSAENCNRDIRAEFVSAVPV